MKRVYRWEVPIDDKDHEVSCGGQFLPNAEIIIRPDAGRFRWSMSFWVVQDDDVTWTPATLAVFGTGQGVPDEYTWRASAPRTKGLVFHLFERTPIARRLVLPQRDA